MYFRKFLISFACIISFIGMVVAVMQKRNLVNLPQLVGVSITLEIIALVMVIIGCFLPLPETPTIVKTGVV